MRRPTMDGQNRFNWFMTVCVFLNPLILALCVVLLFVSMKSASEKSADVIHDGTEGSQPIAGETGRDLTIDYLRTLKPKVDSSAAGVQNLQASMLGATRKIDLIQEQVRDAGYTVTRVERKLIEENARLDKIVNAVAELADAQERSITALKATQDALAGMRFRQVVRDVRDIKRTLERGRGAVVAAGGTDETDLNQLSKEIEALIQETAEVKLYVSQIQELQAQKRQEEEDLQKFLKRYIPSMKTLPADQ